MSFRMLPGDQAGRAEELCKPYMEPTVYTPWMYAFMNKEKKLYAINFNSIEELRRALFDADQIVHGNPSNPSDCKPNPLYQKSDEEILMMIDLGKLPSA